MNDDTIKVAVIGAGAMALEHVRAFNALPDAMVMGITSRTMKNAQKLANEFKIPLCTDTISNLFSSFVFDLVIIAVPVDASRKVLLEVISYGIPILAEKPIGIDLGECEDVVRLARKANVPLWVGLNRRCYSSTQSVLSGLKDDHNLRFIEVYDQQDKEDAIALGYSNKIVENWMFANSIHLIDYVNIYGRGEIIDVTISDHWQADKKSCLVMARIEFSSGDIAHYKAVWGQPGPWACVVTTPKNRWELRPLEVAKVQKSGARELVNIEIDEVDNSFKAGFYLQAEDVAAAVRFGRKTSHVPVAQEVLALTQLITQIYGL